MGTFKRWERIAEAGKGLYLIREVSKMVGLCQKRIREYEKQRLLKPLREENTNNRLYSEFDVAQILQITRLIHERGFTLTSLKNFMVHAPCWSIFECQEKESCPAFQHHERPCFEVWQREHEKPNRRPCSQCPIFLNRDVRKEKILEQLPLKD